MINLFIKSLVVLGAVFAVSAPAFASAQQDHKQLTMAVCNSANDKNVTDDVRKARMSECLEFKRTDALLAHYPTPKTIWVKINYVSDPPGAVLYIATPENRMWQSERTWEVESAKASIADATKSLSDPRWKSEKDKDAGPRFVIAAEQKSLKSLNLQLKELEDSAAATGVREGYSPFTVRYPLDVDTGVKADEKQVFILPATLRWASGATADAAVRIDANRTELYKYAGTERTLTVKRPDNVPGRAVDEEFALKVEASDREKFGQDTPSCRKEAAVVEKERQAILLAKGRVSDAESNKVENDFIAYASRCLPPAQAALIAQRLHDVHVELQMKIDAINARQRSEGKDQLGSQTELMRRQQELLEQQQLQSIMLQQNEQLHQIGVGIGGLLGGGSGQAVQPPPVSNSINCTSRTLGNQVFTNCN